MADVDDVSSARLDRRAVLTRLLAAGGVILVGCDGAVVDVDGGVDDWPDAALPDGEVPDGEAPDGGGEGCDDPFAGGEYLGDVPFTGGDPIPFHEVRRQGWDGRLYTDLSLVDRERPITPNAEFYIRTVFPDLLDLEAMTPWSIEVDGLVAEPGALTLDALMPLVRPMGTHVLECSGNGRRAHFGLLSTARWDGIPMVEVLDRIEALPEATRVLVRGFDRHSVPSAGGHSTPGASWIFTPEQLVERGAFLATGMNGEPLPADHGYPVRLVVPGWYGCTCIKWVDAITLLPDDTEATSQMQEFASRTHQDGVPALARDFAPAAMHLAAMPIRIERWRVDGAVRHRVFGIAWGGTRPTDALTIRFSPGDAFAPIDVCPPMTQNQTWTIWEHAWDPTPGDYVIRCGVADAGIPTRRLDVGFYDRFVSIG